MGKIRIGIVGYGNIGRGVEQSIKRNDDMELKAVFTRRDPASVKIQTEGAEVKHFDDMEAMKDDIDVMILCGGSATDLPVIGPKVAASFNTIDSFDTHAKIPEYFANVDKAAKEGKNVSIISVGWDTSGRIISEGEDTIQLSIQSRQSSISIQIWKEYTDQIEISIINPSGVRVGPVPEILGPHRFRIGQTEILLYYGEPSPYSISQEIYIDLLPVESYLTEGIWRIVLSAGKIVTGQYEMWLPSDNVLNRGTGFLFPTDATTLTIPSSASRAISVGAYDARTFAYADFSGRGFTRLTNMVKPDLVAPGVEVMTTTVGGGYAAFTGTSFATPFVTGSAALLMEWGIVRGNDPYLYGEKVKAYLRRGAKKVPGFDEYPNEEVGYGALCTAQSIPQI